MKLYKYKCNIPAGIFTILLLLIYIPFVVLPLGIIRYTSEKLSNFFNYVTDKVDDIMSFISKWVMNFRKKLNNGKNGYE